MSEIIIREALLRDCKRVCELNRTCLGYDFSENNTLERLKLILGRSTDRVLVAEYGGETAGYVHAADYECTYCDSLKNIMAIAVDEKYRGLGIGRKLLKAAEDWAKSGGCTGVRLVSGFARTQAHKFYLHCGYTLRKDAKNFIKIFNNQI